MKRVTRAVVYRGFSRSTPVDVKVAWITPEVGEIACIECGGSGVWLGNPDGPETCVECKGTGRVFVS